MASHHTQHIWHTSYIDVSPEVAAKVRAALGDGPYAPVDCCGQATKVFLTERA